MTSALYLSISRPSSILAPLLHVTQHIPDYQFRATNSFKTILNIFCICKILLFTGEAMAAESSHRKKMNKGREPTIRIKKKKKKLLSYHSAIQMSMPQTLSLQGQDMRRLFFSMIQTKFEWL